MFSITYQSGLSSTCLLFLVYIPVHTHSQRLHKRTGVHSSEEKWKRLLVSLFCYFFKGNFSSLKFWEMENPLGNYVQLKRPIQDCSLQFTLQQFSSPLPWGNVKVSPPQLLSNLAWTGYHCKALNVNFITRPELKLQTAMKTRISAFCKGTKQS